MIIYFNGDSNVSGAELDRPDLHSMAACLGRKLNAQIVNHAIDGASNDRVYDTTMEFLKSFYNTPNLVIIGWTEFLRMQWFFDSRFYEINNIGVGNQIPPAKQARYDEWKQNVAHDGEFHHYMGRYWHNKIYNMHCLLDHYNIPHLFFNVFNNFNLPPQEAKVDWGNSFLEPYTDKLIYTKWCAEKGYPEITPGKHHYTPDAHEAWAELMYQHLVTQYPHLKDQ